MANSPGPGLCNQSAAMHWRLELAQLLTLRPMRDLDQVSKVIHLVSKERDLAAGAALLGLSLGSLAEWREQSRSEELARVAFGDGIRVTFYGESDYPTAYLGWPEAPACLWYIGEPVWTRLRCLAVVGSRNMSGEVRDWLAWHLAALLARRRILIISGGARGVDQAAHRIAIQQRQATVAFMPLGLARRYPPSFRALEAAILKFGGAVVSPFPPHWPLFKSNFSRRNALMAAMADVTFVAQAQRRSGTMLTARAARDLGREVAVLPCSPLTVSGLGGLDLLFSGAQLVRDDLDLAALCGITT